MKRFSIGAALGDAFGLMRRRPLSVFVWGLLMTAPIFGIFALMIPRMAQFAAMEAAGDGANPFESDQFASMMQFQLTANLLQLGQLLLTVVVYTAVMRAVVRPREASFFSLRIGMDELRVAVVGLAVGVGVYAALIIVVLLGASVGVMAWQADPSMALWLIIGMVILGVIGLFWAMARVSLLAPASVLSRDFAFARGWRLAQGQSWRLFLMMLAVWLVVLMIEIGLALVGLVLVWGGAIGGMFRGFDPTTPAANPFLTIEQWTGAHWAMAAVIGLLIVIFYGMVLVLSVAPFASACRQLADRAAPSEPA